MKKALLVIIFMSLTVSSALSQADDKEDPFRNDPFFNKKIEDLLHKNATQDSVINDSSGNSDFNLRYINNNGIDLGGALEAGPYTSNPLYSVYPNLPMIHFNRVNGLFLGIRKERMQWLDDDSFLGISDFRTHWMAGYSTGFARQAIYVQPCTGKNDTGKNQSEDKPDSFAPQSSKVTEVQRVCRV